MSQRERLLDLLKDGEPHSTIEILNEVYGVEHYGVARISARIIELRREGYLIDGWKDKEKKTVYWYRLVGSRASAAPKPLKAAQRFPLERPPAELFEMRRDPIGRLTVKECQK